MSGWYAMRRGAHDHVLFKHKPDRFFVWSWLLANAAWEVTSIDVHGFRVEVKRGQIVTTQREIEKATGVGRQVIRTLLRELELTQTLTQHPTHQSTQAKTVITICNYDKYQNGGNTSNPAKNQRATTSQPTKEQITNNNTSSNEEDGALPPSSTVEVNILSKAVWSAGKPFLASRGVNNPGAVIGKWLKSSTPLQVLAAIEAAQRVGTEDPVPYITTLLGEKPKPKNDWEFDLKDFEQEARQ